MTFQTADERDRKILKAFEAACPDPTAEETKDWTKRHPQLRRRIASLAEDLNEDAWFQTMQGFRKECPDASDGQLAEWQEKRPRYADDVAAIASDMRKDARRGVDA